MKEAQRFGIVEKIAVLKREEQVKNLDLIRRRDDELEAKKENYDRQYPQIRKHQAQLLEDLREKGVLEIIEELIDAPILPLRDREGNYIVRKPTEEEHMRQTAGSKSRYAGTIVGPDFDFNYDERGELLDPTVKIELSNKDLFGKVMVTYDEYKTLKISGEYCNYHGTLATKQKPDMEAVVSGLAQAFVYPRV